eukprot:960327_1
MSKPRVPSTDSADAEIETVFYGPKKRARVHPKIVVRAPHPETITATVHSANPKKSEKTVYYGPKKRVHPKIVVHAPQPETITLTVHSANPKKSETERSSPPNKMKRDDKQYSGTFPRVHYATSQEKHDKSDRALATPTKRSRRGSSSVRSKSATIIPTVYADHPIEFSSKTEQYSGPFERERTIRCKACLRVKSNSKFADHKVRCKERMKEKSKVKSDEISHSSNIINVGNDSLVILYE